MDKRHVKIRTIVLCLPVGDPDRSLAFYRNVFGYRDATIEDGIIALELPNLSLFLMDKDAFEIYSRKAGCGANLPGANTGVIISCAMETAEAVDAMRRAAPTHAGSAPDEAGMDENSGGYTGYIRDPDGHLWELVFPQRKTEGG